MLAAANKYHIKPDLIYAIIETESCFNPFVVSRSNVYGLMQVIPATAGKDVYEKVLNKLKLEGQFNVTIAEQAFKRIINRNQPLRTVFKQGDDGPVQVIRTNVEFALNLVNLSYLNGKESLKDTQQQTIDEAMKTDAATAFDLSQDLMLRASFLQCSENSGVLLLNIHHIAADGWSIGILLDEFVQQYQSIEAGKPDPLPPLTVQYSDFAQWQKTTLTGDYLKPKLDYWASHLADCPQVHHLPLSQTRQASRRQSGTRQSGNHSQVVDSYLLNDLNALCHKQQTTLFMLLQAAFAVHIGRCSFETDVMMGAPVAGRAQQALEPMIGLLLNTQVYRTRFDDNPSFETLLNRTRQDHLEAAGFGDVPFELLVDKINPERSLNHSPLFQILINMDNTEQDQSKFTHLSNLNKLIMTPLGDSRHLGAKYELTLYIKQTDDSLTFDWVYDSNLFNAPTITMMAREFAWLLQKFVNRPAQPVLNHSWSDSRGWLKNAHRHSPKAQTQGSITELFERQVKRVPNQVAVSCAVYEGRNEQISYQQLNQKANQLAHYLDQEWRILFGDRVAFASERGIHRVVAILAVLKLGAVYVPLSAELPAKRLAGMLEDAKVHCILADTASLKWLQLNNTYNNLDAQSNQDVPFEHLVEQLNPQRTMQYSPLFQVVISLNDAPTTTAKQGDLTFTPMHNEQVSAKFELNLVAQSTDNGLGFNLLYNTDLFAAQTIEAMGQHLSTLLRGIVATPNAKLADLPLLNEAQRHHQIETLNPRKDETFDQSCIHQRFAKHANATPDAIALVMNSETMTYKALDKQANQLAHYLIAKDVKPGAFVGIALGRSIKMVVAMLAVLKAGAAYVPIDTSYPQHRIDHMINDSGLTVLLTEQDLDCLEGLPDTPIELPYFNNNQLAHLIYTSGTTGLPKGVMLTHKGTMGLVCRSYGALLNTDTVVLQVAAVSFDAATVEIWSALLNGGKLVLLPPGPIDLAVLNTQVTEHQINTLFITAGLFTLWSMDLPPTSPVKWLMTGGDVVSPGAVARTYQQFENIEVFCCYGPTENSVFTSVYPIPRDFDASKPLPLGKGLAATHNYILSAEQTLLPLGAVGELYTGGQRLARGYLNLEQTTHQSFIADPFLPGQVMYKTGDYVRMQPEGNLEFGGRVDNQVKIRGFRVEVSEIESQLSQIGASGAVVIVREDNSGDKHLVAYYTGGECVDTIRQQLAARVPEFMVPSAFVLLDELPLTANGKLDRKALPSPEFGLGHFVKPQTPMAQRLALIWAELLSVDVDKISDTADFFVLGGHSLLCIRLISQISAQLNIQLGIHDVFNAPQLGQMAQLLFTREVASERDCLQRRPEIEAVERELILGEYYQLTMSFAQQRLWFIDRLSGSTQYHMTAALQIDGPFDEARAEAAFKRIIERHEPLRTVFVEGAQRIRREFDFTLPLVDLGDQPFDLEHDLMLRASFVRRYPTIRNSPQQGILTITLHHIASDGWSMGLLFKEFAHYYQGLDSLPELSVQYADYALWQRNYLAGAVLEQQLGFWQQQLADMPLLHSLPLDKARPQQQSYNGADWSFELDKTTLEGLKQLAIDNNVTLFMVLHGAFALLLSRYGASDDIVIATPVANRLQPKLEPLIGFFVNTLVLRLNCAGPGALGDYLSKVKTVNLDAQTHQDLPFEHLVEHLNPTRSTAHSPIFQIMFSMMTSDNGAQMPAGELTVKPLKGDKTIAKFELSLTAHENADGLAFNLTYNTDLFEQKTMKRLSTYLTDLLSAMVASPAAQVHTLAISGRSCVSGRTVAKPQHNPQSISQLIAAQLHEEYALVFESQSITYGQLNRQSNQLANYLLQKCVSKDVLVGVCIPRSIEMIVAMVAILKAGGAYVPLDPEYPAARLDYMIKDSGVSLVIYSGDIDCNDFSDTSPAVVFDSRAAAYVIYTSGSTGKPKGVVVEHGAVNNFIEVFDQQLNDLSVSNLNAWLLNASIAFDASVKALIALSKGAKLVIASSDESRDPAALARLVKQHDIPVFNSVPQLVEQVLDYFGEYNLGEQQPAIIVGGEALPVKLWQRLADYRAINAYGPTEATINASYAVINTQQPVNIGRAVHNAQLYVLDRHQQLAIDGAVGELYIGGAGLARGYLNRPELNAFIDYSGVRLYRTGDLVRWVDECLVFVGRVDEQVNLFGLRIEAGEVEYQLNQLNDVKSCVVMARENQLVAYVESANTESLRAELEQLLPRYMVPAVFISIEQWPLTATGKIDKKALPAPGALGLGMGLGACPRIERELRGSWFESVFALLLGE